MCDDALMLDRPPVATDTRDDAPTEDRPVDLGASGNGDGAVGVEPDVVDEIEQVPPGPPSPLQRRWLAITAFVVAACNTAFSGDRIIFHLIPDEPGTLAMGRWLSGRNRWNMFDHSTWQPALSFFVTPVYWVTDEAEWVVRWAIFVNALLAGAAAAVALLLVRRLSGWSTQACALVAILLGVLPATLSGASYIWAEPLVSLTFCATVLLATRTFDGGGARMSHGAVIAAAAGYFSHARLLPFVATTLATVLGILLWQRRFRLAATTTATALASFAVVRWITVTIHTNVWDDPGRVNTSGSILRRLDEPGVILDHLIGQLWYQLVVTLGITALGMVVVLRTIVTGDRPGIVDRRSAIVIAVLTAPQIAVSATFLAGRDRADQLVYGRYNDAVMWPVVIVGICWLVHLARTGWNRRADVDVAITLVAIVGMSIAVEIRHGDVLHDDIGLRAMVPGLLAFMGTADAVAVIRISAITIAAFAVMLLGATFLRRRPTPTLVAALVLATGALFWGGLRTYEAEARLLNGWAKVEVVQEVVDLVPPDATFGVKMVSDRDDPSISWERQRHRYQIYQLYLPRRTFLRDRGLDDAVGPYVFAPRDDPELTEAGAEVIWNDPDTPMTLYLEPSG